MRRIVLCLAGLFLLAACGPDIMLSPADFTWKLNNRTDRSIVVRGSIQFESDGVRQDHDIDVVLGGDESCVLAEFSEESASYGPDYLSIFMWFITGGEVELVDAGSGAVLAAWTYGRGGEGGRDLFCKECQSRFRVGVNSENRSVVDIEFDITENDI